MIDVERENAKLDAINPDHYKKQCDIECMDAIILALGEEGAVQMCLGNIIKYLWRADHKNAPLENIDKAEWYLKKASELTHWHYGWGWKDDPTLKTYKHMIDKYRNKYTATTATFDELVEEWKEDEKSEE